MILASFGALALVALAGCGHPASVEECDVLFKKSAEIELKAQPNNDDPKRLEEQIESARAAPQGTGFMSRCVGRRITARALACVRGAATADQMDRCF